MRNSSMSRREHGVTPTDETQAMTPAERSHIEAQALSANGSRVVVSRIEAVPPADGVEYGFEELVENVRTEKTLDDSPHHPVDRTSAGHRRAQSQIPKRPITKPDALEMTLDAPQPRLANPEIQQSTETRESTKIEQEIIYTSLGRVLGTKLDLPIAFRLLERASTELPDALLDLCAMVEARVHAEMTLVQEANKANIDMPYTVAQLQKALDYLDEQTR